MKKYLSVGPPVYFVLKGDVDFMNMDQQNKICGTVDCHVDSLTTQIYLSSLQSNRTYIAQPTSSWVDDYFDWSTNKIDSDQDYNPPCCRVTKHGKFCPSDNQGDCLKCNISLATVSEIESFFIFLFYLYSFLGWNSARPFDLHVLFTVLFGGYSQ